MRDALELAMYAGLALIAIACFRAWYQHRSPRVELPPPREDALEDAPPRVPLPKLGSWVLVLGRRGCVVGDGEYVYAPVSGRPYWQPCVLVMFDTGREKFTPEEWRVMVQAEPPAVL